MPNFGPVAILKTDILDIKSTILFFVRFSPLKLFSIKKGRHKEKRYYAIYLPISFAKIPICNQPKDFRKRRKTLLKNPNFVMIILKIGSHSSRLFFKSSAEFLFCKKYAKKDLYLWKFRKIKVDLGPLFLLNLGKKARDQRNFHLIV